MKHPCRALPVLWRRSAVPIATAVAMACSSATEMKTPEPRVVAVEVYLSGPWPAAPTDTLRASARGLDSTGATIPGFPTQWGISDTTRATITADGLVTARAPGTVAIRATIRGVTGTAPLDILAGVESVAVSPPAMGIVPGDTLLIAVALFDSTGAPLGGRVMTWTSSNQAVVRVVEPGRALSVGPGIATVTVAREGRAASAVIEVATPRFTAVSAGSDHTCALATDGRAWCWGAGGEGRLGNGTALPAPRPRRVAGTIAFDSIDAGAGRTCGLTASHDLYCWGLNQYGGVGDGTTTHRLAPVRIGPAGAFVAVTVEGASTCAVATSGLVFCWGYNVVGQLGDGTTQDRTQPTPVQGLGTATAVGTGQQGSFYGYEHTCAVGSDASVRCWGGNREGQLGDGARTTAPVTAPVLAVAGGPYRSVAVGGDHTCALQTDGQAWCWGGNWNGTLGRGFDIDQPFDSVPKPVVIAACFASLSAGQHHTCGIDLTGVTWCWGNGFSGQLGNAGVPYNPGVPNQVPGPAFARVSAGERHTCAVAADGAWCWGDNNVGQSGTTGSGSATARKVLGQP